MFLTGGASILLPFLPAAQWREQARTLTELELARLTCRVQPVGGAQSARDGRFPASQRLLDGAGREGRRERWGKERREVWQRLFTVHICVWMAGRSPTFLTVYESWFSKCVCAFNHLTAVNIYFWLMESLPLPQTLAGSTVTEATQTRKSRRHLLRLFH